MALLDLYYISAIGASPPRGLAGISLLSQRLISLRLRLREPVGDVRSRNPVRDDPSGSLWQGGVLKLVIERVESFADFPYSLL